MARGRRRTEQVEEVKTMDFEGGKRVYFEDVKPARSQASEHMQAVSTAMKLVKKRLGMVPGAYQAALKIYEMEAGKQEAFIRTLVGQLNELAGRELVRHTFNDLVDQAQQDDGYARPKPEAVQPDADGSEDDFMAAANAVIDAIDGAEAQDEVQPEVAAKASKPRKASVTAISALN
ncbi:MAG: hypothetical protein ACOVQ0_16510 [Novosphingobium sp.]|uniref:hypothetical protein n=1 Tax=Novosphingobium sp. TaxID=1874826 RepID=UPI003B9DBF55